MPQRTILQRGERVHLVRPGPDDGEELTRRNRASRKLHEGRVQPPTHASHYAEYLARIERPDCEGLLIRRNEDDAIVGVINLSQIFLGNFKSAYMGYYAVLPHAGHGYMAEAVELALRHAFRALRLHRVEANIQPGNEASRRIAIRAGFRLEGYSPRYLKIGGRWRDHERWAALADPREDDPEQPAALAVGLRGGASERRRTGR